MAGPAAWRRGGDRERFRRCLTLESGCGNGEQNETRAVESRRIKQKMGCRCRACALIERTPLRTQRLKSFYGTISGDTVQFRVIRRGDATFAKQCSSEMLEKCFKRRVTVNALTNGSGGSPLLTVPRFLLAARCINTKGYDTLILTYKARGFRIIMEHKLPQQIFNLIVYFIAYICTSSFLAFHRHLSNL
jgi:hypothetical protein